MAVKAYSLGFEDGKREAARVILQKMNTTNDKFLRRVLEQEIAVLTEGDRK